MKVVITGGAGYAGVPLCAALLAHGHHVTIVDNFMFGYDSVLPLVTNPRLEVVKTDIRHEDRPYLRHCDAVFHLAAISGYPACEANPHSAKLINLDATIGIMRDLAPGQLLVFASTTSFYGSSGELATEDTPPRPASLYGTTKYHAEQAVMERRLSIALRWATVFGVSPRMRRGLIVNDFAEAAVQERTIVLYDAESRRAYIHIDDMVRGYLFALSRADNMVGAAYNMGCSRLNYTKRELAERIAAATPCDILEARIGDTDVRNFLVSFDRAGALGFDCCQTLEVGIEQLVRLFRFYTPNSFIKPI